VDTPTGGTEADQFDALMSEITDQEPADTIAAFSSFPDWVDSI